MTPEVAALQEIWSQWGIPSQEKKAVHRTDEWDTLGCRVAGTLGVSALPRGVISELLGLTGWFCDPAVSKSFRSWRADGRDASNSGEKLPAHSCICGPPSSPPVQQKPTLEIVMDLLVAICVSCRSHASTCATASALSSSPRTRQKVASASSDPPRSRLQAVTLRALSTAAACDQLGIIEPKAGIGGLWRSVELLERVPGVYEACRR